MAPAEDTQPGQPSAAMPAWWIAAPLVLALLLLAVELLTDADRVLMRFAFDEHARVFPLRGSFWLDVVMHHWAKYAVAMVGCLLAAALVISFVLPPLRERRAVLLFLVLALGLAPLSVTMGKAMSARHCPWDAAEFGGPVPYTPLFGPGAHDIEPGHCFPAGHASTGFALMAFYFAAHARRRKTAARAALLAGFGAGLVLGLGRVLQGAHFPSHVLWSGVLCWSVMVVLYVIVFRTPSGAAERTAAVVISESPQPAPPA